MTNMIVNYELLRGELFLRKPQLNKNFTMGCSFENVSANKIVREIEMAVSILMSTPTPSVRANPLTDDVPIQKSTKAVMILEMLESRIESQAR